MAVEYMAEYVNTFCKFLFHDYLYDISEILKYLFHRVSSVSYMIWQM